METESTPPPVPATDRKAGFWAWPLIILSVCYIVLQPTLFPEKAAESEGEGGSEEVVAVPNPLEMKIFEMQGKMIVGIAPTNLLQAHQMVGQLEDAVTSDQTAIATALLYQFVDFRKEGAEKAAEVIANRRAVKGADNELLDRANEMLEAGATPDSRVEWEPWIGWYSKIIPGEDGTVPGKPALQATGMMVAALATILLLGVGLAGAAGLILLIIGLVKKNDGKLLVRFDQLKRPAGIFLEAFAIYLFLMAASDVVGIFFQGMPFLEYLSPVFYLASFVLALMWPVLRGIKWRRVRKSLGLHRGAGVLREIGAGFVGYLAMLPIAAVGISITILLMLAVGLDMNGNPRAKKADAVESAVEGAAETVIEDATEIDSVPSAPTHPIAEWIALGDWKVKLFVFILAAVIAPLFEETMFRGALFRAVRSRWRFLASALIGGFIFAIIHPQGWLGAPALTAMGLGFCMIREWRDSLIAPMTAHSINNGMITLGLISIM